MPLSLEGLRLRAEATVSQDSTSSEDQTPIEGDDSAEQNRLLHQLRLQEAELRIQNEEMRSQHDHLLETQERYRGLLEASAVGLLECDDATFVTSVNPAALAMLDRPLDKVLGHALALLVEEGNRLHYLRHVDAVTSTGKAHRCELTLPSADGPRYIEMHSVPFREREHDAWSLRSTLIDITDRKRQEAELSQYREQLEVIVGKRTKQLQVLQEEMLFIISSLSHDLRAPLRNMSAHAGFIGEDLQEIPARTGEWASIQESAEAIQQLSHAADKHILKVLTLIRSEHYEPLPEVIDTRTLVEDVLLLLGVGDAVDIQHGPWPSLYADAFYMNQILINLIDNAVKHNIDASVPVEVGWRQSDPLGIELFIRDAGPGIAEKRLEKIFELFSASGPAKGTGLGLSIVKKGVERLDGMIRIDSALGIGTTFYVRLPVKTP